jgi:hypothetical protein
MDLTSLISQVGFPMGVAVYLLMKVVPSINANTAVLNRIAQKLDVKE